jgi:ubiquinone/menaquinone biosynthesis C-methylase UbiE
MSSPPASEEAAKHLDADHAWRKNAVRQPDRLERTLALLPEGISSLLDVGIGEGDWLQLLAERRPGLELAALDLSPQRLADLEVRQGDGRPVAKHEGDVTKMPLEDDAVDVVSLLEVIEHVTDWEAAVRDALRVARRGVLITVPYRELLQTTVCVHCNQATPLWGHIHRFDEGSFDGFLDEARIRLKRIPRKPGREHGLLRYIYRTLRPVTPWIGFWLEKKR